MTSKIHLQAIEELNPEALKADGFDDAIIGLGSIAGNDDILVYDANKCIKILMDRDGMSYDDACEFFDFNVRSAYVGQGTPMFVHTGPFTSD
jgi:hypothetical protein